MAMRKNPHQRIKTVRLAMKLFIVVIFLGHVMIWIMMPTNTFWLHWLPNIQSKANSTYFGQQGANILIYTFPILSIATLGCLYLHLGKKLREQNNESRAKNPPLASWTRPALVKGPLGIVSWTELSFFCMFIALLIWSFSAYLHGMFANITRESAARMNEKKWEVKLDSASLMLGLVGNICLAFLFFPVTRGSSILRLIGLTSESGIKYHIWLGHIVLTLFTAHGLCYITFWFDKNQLSEMIKWDTVGVSNVAGEVALLFGLAMWAASFPCIRRKMFELFFYTHNLYILFIVFFVFHVSFSYSCITLPGFYLFLIDRYLRFLQSQQRVRLVSARVLPCQAVELNFSKSLGLSYNPTSTLFVNVPGISRLQWHPFSITSNSNMEPEKLSIVIKSEGSWSEKLYQKISSPSSMERVEISVEGPYGPASTHFLRHDMLVMVSGGSGITPFISIIRELLFTASTSSCKKPRILLIAAFRKAEDLTMLDLLIPVSASTTYDISHLQLQIEAYVTREDEPIKDDQKHHRTIWFKPSALDAPVSAVLGSNNWLWLGAIISSSFVIFLLLIGILTRYYIYPIDHNTNMIYSNTSRSALNMLFISISIVMTATAAFLWNKKGTVQESRLIQNTDMPTPVTSPGSASQFYSADRELESLPHQSFIQATKVHFGERPNLKKMLLEREGSSIGVLVSGPWKMRQEVAAICSSGLANNLHFESISFSW
ncbi:ferric reduction oxidase 2-like [Cornus florida]|uniref:ferric reduction oxidase 2-like n=1 Tax=Cornus florida TaxID=4283 RepID=UPI002899FE66|nr:ferric reduction oxidase 2-like [Cornus florida]